MKLKIPLNEHERASVFERDPEAFGKARNALMLVRQGKITGDRFLRLIQNYQGEALARFTRQCAEVAHQRLRGGWYAINSKTGPIA